MKGFFRGSIKGRAELSLKAPLLNWQITTCKNPTLSSKSTLNRIIQQQHLVKKKKSTNQAKKQAGKCDQWPEEKNQSIETNP